MLVHGGFNETFKYISKWCTWMTYLLFVTGLYSCSPLPTDSTVLLKSYKNNPMQSWKWFTILFEVLITLEIWVCFVFWVFFAKTVFKNNSLDWKTKTSTVMEHVVPLLALSTEFLMSN